MYRKKRKKVFSLSYVLHKKRESENMVEPKTYKGYDEDGQQICYCTAIDAKTFINPEDVQTALDNVEKALSEEMQTLSTNLSAVTDTAEKAIIAEGTNMAGAITEVSEALPGVTAMVMGSINTMYDTAVDVHDKFQEELNDQAKSNVSGYTGVVRVSE